MRTKNYVDKNGTKVTIKSMSMSMVVYVTEYGTEAKMSYKNFIKRFTKVA